ncbi:MAG: hypothetical protein AB7T49_10730 [Oligoflexales bacterium]
MTKALYFTILTALLPACSPNPARKDRRVVDPAVLPDQSSAGDTVSNPEEEKAASENPTVEVPEGATVNYTEHVSLIIEAACLGAGCHTSPGAASVNLDSYQNVMTFFDASINAINAGRMPIGRTVSPEDLVVLEAWKKAGFPENADSTPAPETTKLPISFARDIQPIMAVSCLGADCHSRPSPKKGVALETAADLQQNFEDAMDEIADGKMPIGGKPDISQEQLAKIREWQQAGFPD